MSDFEDRLAALDPAAGQPYRHRDLDELVSRITAAPVVRKPRRWRTFEMRLAGTLITGALVTVGSVALLQSGPALPVLAIKGALGTTIAKSASPSASGAMQIYERFNFSAGSGLSATAAPSPSYQLQIPGDPAREATRVAAIFGVVGPPDDPTRTGSDWLVTSASKRTLDYATSGVPQWTYDAPTTLSTTSTSDPPSRSTLAHDVQHYVAALGYGYSLAAPSFDITSASDATSTGAGTADVSFTVDVAGIATTQRVDFSVDANNHVVRASGPAFYTADATNYPLESPSAGVRALNAEQQSRFGGVGGSSASTGARTNAQAGATADTSSTTTTFPGPPVVGVVLDAFTLALQTYQLTNGALWLLPEYHFTGTESRGSASSASWNELAVDPQYVDVRGPGSAGGVVNY